ncbi:alpha/beta fold hydrolase [Edaphobacter aggregans]|uniref:alpha/beta fold hydrolase n=1 Tax=Edaphobacter aggregans TaxID=570835 RepID=UPI0014703E64|nr:alpha/beta hydrolase [Edaphobacter aggregans]
MRRNLSFLFYFVAFIGPVSSYVFAETHQAALKQGPHDAQLGDVRIHYVVSGHGPLIFMTSVGWGLSSLLYQNGLKPLEDHFTMVYVDERGNGDSSQPEDLKQMSSSVMADDLDHLRDYLGLDKICLIGHSSGGTITLEYAERHPTHLEKGILIDPAVLGDRDDKQIEEYISLWKDDPKYKKAVKNVPDDDDTPKTNAEATARLLSYINLYFSNPEIYVPIFLKQAKGSQVSATTENAHKAADRVAAREQRQDYGIVQAKILIINGTVDWICPYQVAQRIYQGISGSELDLYANVGHFPWIEEPHRFFSDVTAFLDQKITPTR